MKKKTKKLVLAKETMLRLDTPNLRPVVGGSGQNTCLGCPETCTASGNMFCLGSTTTKK